MTLILSAGSSPRFVAPVRLSLPASVSRRHGNGCSRRIRPGSDNDRAPVVSPPPPLSPPLGVGRCQTPRSPAVSSLSLPPSAAPCNMAARRTHRVRKSSPVLPVRDAGGGSLTANLNLFFHGSSPGNEGTREPGQVSGASSRLLSSLALSCNMAAR